MHTLKDFSQLYTLVHSTSISGQSIFPPVMSLDSQSAASDKEKASQYLHSVLTTSFSALLSTNEMTLPLYSIDSVVFNELNVFKAIRSPDVWGYDGISPMILKHCAMALYQPLYHIFSLSLSPH